MLQKCYVKLVGLALLATLCLCVTSTVPQEESLESEVRVVSITGAIGPATSDFFNRALRNAAEDQVELLVMELDTPGGLVSSLRDMVKEILASPIPVAVYVMPDGARAASAGTYLTFASHVAAMSPVTNIGSSTPVSIGGGGNSPSPGGGWNPFGNGNDSQDSPSEETTDPSPTAMDKKVVNDAVAYIRSLAELRGRNADWAEQSVREASNLTAAEALELNVIDFIAIDLEDLLAQVDGMKIAGVDGQEITLNTKNATVTRVKSDWRYELLKTITDPNVAYLLLIIGLNALLFEFYNPGLGAGGVIGIICLLLAAYALQMMPVSYVGLALIIVGFGMLVAEAITPTFGVLILGGVVAFVSGSLLLFDTDMEGFQVSIWIVLAIVVATVILVLVVGRRVWQSWKRGPVSGVDELVGATATVLADSEGEGRVRAAGETWKAICDAPMSKDETVIVKAVEGLTLKVEKVS